MAELAIILRHCYGSTAIFFIIIHSVRGSSLDVRIWILDVRRRQIVTSENGPALKGLK